MKEDKTKGQSKQFVAELEVSKESQLPQSHL